MKRSLVDELIAERRVEEFRENIGDKLRLDAGNPEFRRVAGNAFAAMAGEWGLSAVEAAALLSASDREYQKWIAGDFAHVDTEHLEKISCLMGIYRYLATLYSGHFDRVGAWLKRKNAGVLYGGKTPYDLLVGAEANAFHLVRRDLAASTVSP